jgi:hypothetical protein
MPLYSGPQKERESIHEHTLNGVPSFLSHYYEEECGPFLNLSDLPLSDAEVVQEQIRKDGRTFASKRPTDYVRVRRELEDRVRQEFIRKGGRPQRERPHYLVVGDCPWLTTWYRRGRVVRIPMEAVEASIISFTYGDLFPAMRVSDGRPYRGQVYTLEELPLLIHTFGLPQVWNANGRGGPERYIEAQLWSDKPTARMMPGFSTLNEYLQSADHGEDRGI